MNDVYYFLFTRCPLDRNWVQVMEGHDSSERSDDVANELLSRNRQVAERLNKNHHHLIVSKFGADETTGYAFAWLDFDYNSMCFFEIGRADIHDVFSESRPKIQRCAVHFL